MTEQYATNETGFAHFYLATELKRKGDYEAAAQSFENALPTLPERKQAQAYEQLAMLYEHQLKDEQRAHNFAENGKKVTQSSYYAKPMQQARQMVSWENRLNRLTRKMAGATNRKI